MARLPVPSAAASACGTRACQHCPWLTAAPPPPPPPCSYISLIKDEGLESVAAAPSSPAWAKQITKSVADRTNSTALDMKFAQSE